MQEIAQHLRAWRSAGDAFAVATVVSIGGSAPRQPGAALAVHADGRVVGSVSGGCVEGAVYELAQEVLETGIPVRHRFGYSDETAFSVGLTCGGTVEVFVEAVAPGRTGAIDSVLAALEAEQPAALATVVTGPTDLLGSRVAIHEDGYTGSTGHLRLDEAIAEQARGHLHLGRTSMIRVGRQGERLEADVEVFVQSFASPARMLVFGAIDFAAALAKQGRLLGYRVTVCDARALFATKERFPDADEVVVEWPHRYLASTPVDGRTVVCVLTHDHKFDVPVLQVALSLPVAYVGAMGSRRTHRERVARLVEAGVGAEELARLHSPIGLDLGARTPEETAVAIAAEVISARWGGSGERLSDQDSAVHRDHRPVHAGDVSRIHDRHPA